jgi:hypothetical protein
MGGEVCDDCSTCIGSELCAPLPLRFNAPWNTDDLCSALAAAHPNDVDQRFEQHWYGPPRRVLLLLEWHPFQG